MNVSMKHESTIHNSIANKPTAHILLIDDELSICTGIQGLLECYGFQADYALTYNKGLEYLDQNPEVDIVLLDINLRSDLSGIEIIPLIKEKNKYIQIIMFTSYERMDIGLECMKRGAIDVLNKPFDEKRFLNIAAIAIEKKRLEQIQDLYFDMVVHDLKNPLQCLCGSIEMLSDQFKENLSPLQQKLFETADNAIQQIQLIIGNILGITRFEKGSLTARRDNIPIVNTINDTIKLFDCVEIYFQTPLPETIRTDRDLFIRTLSNIINNAIRFTAINSNIIIQCEYDNVEKFLITSISYSGSFISKEHRELIFNKFIGVQRSVSSLKGYNFGLGLTFSKIAIEALGGTIYVDSDETSQKTTFKFTVKDYTVT